MKASLTLAALLTLTLGPPNRAQATPNEGVPASKKSDAPSEKMPGVETYLRWVPVDEGVRLRAAIARPAGATRPLHPVLFTQWVSCGSLAYREGSEASEILAAVARASGHALVRVERHDCAKLDYDTELAHYVAAYKTLLKDPSLDASKVFVYGSSLGSTVAPLLARALEAAGFDVAGVVVQGGGAVTHFERMLTFERHYLERRPNQVPRGRIHEEMTARTRFLVHYLLEGLHPDAVAKRDPELTRIRGDILGLGETDHYGRPFAWHQQAARHDFLEAWASLDAEVLVIFNAFDQYEGRHGHALIAKTVNDRRPGRATFVEQAGLGHSSERFETVEAAYAGRNGEPAWPVTAKRIVTWLRARAPKTEG